MLADRSAISIANSETGQAAVSAKTTDSVLALALSVNTRWMTTPWSAKNSAASTRNRAQVAPVSSGRSWLKATRERSSTAEWR
jgi:hypothetical protein